MRYLILPLVCLLSALGLACAPTDGPTDNAPSLGELALVSDAQARADATQAVRSGQIAAQNSARATAVRQITLDWQMEQQRQFQNNQTTTWDAATVAALEADRTTTADHRTLQARQTNEAGATTVAQSVRETATAALYQTETATRVAGEQTVAATRTMGAQTAQASATHAAGTPTALAIELATQQTLNQLKQEESDAWWGAFWAPLRALGEALLPLIVALVVIAIAALGLFILVRLYLMWESRRRLVNLPENTTIIIEPQNRLGGNPKYRHLPPPEYLQLPAPEAGGALLQDEAISTTSLVSRWLNLAEQPRGKELPMGVTAQGDLWLAGDDAGHVVVGGPSGSGKSSLGHGLIMGLQHHGGVNVWCYDGKGGIEYERYAAAPRTRYIADDELTGALAELLDDMAERYTLLRTVSARNLREYNVRTDFTLAPVYVVIDELKVALERPGVLEQLVTLMRVSLAAGFHLILLTQNLDAKSIPIDIRSNATTRIAFAVADHYQSAAILGSSGAEKLPKVKGRFLIEHAGARQEVQAFRVEPPPAPLMQDAPPIPFTDLEKKILALVLHEADSGGRYWFKTRQLAQGLKMDDTAITEVATAWEQRGWVSGEKMNVGRPGRNGRQVLPRLLDMARRYGLTEEAVSDMGMRARKTAETETETPSRPTSSVRPRRPQVAHIGSAPSSPAE